MSEPRSGDLEAYVRSRFATEPALLADLREILETEDFPTIQVPPETGRILDSDDDSAATRGIRDFNRRLAEHAAFRATILPVGDGVALAVKR